MTTAHDPLQINSRLYNQIARLLDDLEAKDAKQNLDIKERIAALIAVGRIQIMFVNLRKENLSGTGSGSAVRKYKQAFAKANAAGGRKKAAGRGRAGAAQLADDDFADDDDTA
jgi:hypothetical protein